MVLDSFRQDVRVGVRVLLKEKAFCFLAVLVLALGIGGATTQFTVVNTIVLRGFSFPHPEQLVGIGLIDPKASDQNNNFGNGTILTAQDYEDIKAAQKSLSMMAGYLRERFLRGFDVFVILRRQNGTVAEVIVLIARLRVD